eukprot:Plantae.Rhodophyta-Purpureofilum_apyrenoidigerum.ctg18878.p1 GENE.Plantae.Rhodophyta-Purpureofilum_apyrenoidigerum.ctg18878~~Plantae.Rhodophyta-Purpureofilum_apyrenoidigerum.ctg18878.p1  ORF type:complete len:210 (+),score=30.52 Plantae.Rhodophyta-Purpureofilum_apyrenoidigerum.ctg18878:337-966(+)
MHLLLGGQVHVHRDSDASTEAACVQTRREREFISTIGEGEVDSSQLDGMLVNRRDNGFMGKRPKKMDIVYLTEGFAGTSAGEESSSDHRDSEVVCRVCGRGFVKVSTMRDHMRTHTDEKSYKCGMGGCEKSFKWRSSLSQHRKKHKEKLREPAKAISSRGGVDASMDLARQSKRRQRVIPQRLRAGRMLESDESEPSSAVPARSPAKPG